MPRNNLKIIASGAFLLSLLAIFRMQLSSGSEVFFMSIPIFAVGGGILFKPAIRLTPKMILSGISTFLVLMIITLGMFHYLENLLYGRIIWREVFLSGYFLLSVGLLIIFLKGSVRKAAEMISRPIKNVFIQKSLYGLLRGLFWILVIFPFLLETFTIHRPKIGDRLNPESALAINFKNIEFETKDRVKLQGWYIPTNTNKAVIIGHGLGANKSNFLTVAELWHDLGFNVLIFDFRGHGQSQGHTVSFGYHERRDIEAGLDYLMSRKDIDPQKIIGYGVSFGGAAIIQAAAEDSRLKAIIIDSTYANLDEMALKTVERFRFVPSILVKIISGIGLSMAGLENGFDIRKYSPQWAIAKVQQPVLFLHGKKDTLIPWQESEKLYADANEPKFLRFFDTQGHYTTLNDLNYRTTILEFLRTTGH